MFCSTGQRCNTSYKTTKSSIVAYGYMPCFFDVVFSCPQYLLVSLSSLRSNASLAFFCVSSSPRGWKLLIATSLPSCWSFSSSSGSTKLMVFSSMSLCNAYGQRYGRVESCCSRSCPNISNSSCFLFVGSRSGHSAKERRALRSQEAKLPKADLNHGAT